MHLVDLSGISERRVDANGSSGLSVGGLGLTSDAHLVVVHLRPGGVIGRHPAPARQLLVVVSGDATVAGGDSSPVEIGPGQAVVWEAGEPHETRSSGGLLGFLVEGDLDVRTGPVGEADPP
ncbi:cupin domain-containing protein [Nocardioides sp.]|uniref:cupin domain-containing protein n=1 Tax=Nocardioides sp. TaxID=35761 RepID=UPI00356705AE